VVPFGSVFAAAHSTSKLNESVIDDDYDDDQLDCQHMKRKKREKEREKKRPVDQEGACPPLSSELAAP
jgi:hypothetical protein